MARLFVLLLVPLLLSLKCFSHPTESIIHDESSVDRHIDGVSRLTKRHVPNLEGNKPADKHIIERAFKDMVNVVNYVSDHPNHHVLARYFDHQHFEDVNAVFQIVKQMASDEPPESQETLIKTGPQDLKEIRIFRAPGTFGAPVLAEAFNFFVRSTDHHLKIYDFGWDALFKRLRADIKCDDIGPKTNYKMHFLGTLMLHEILYVEGVYPDGNMHNSDSDRFSSKKTF